MGRLSMNVKMQTLALMVGAAAMLACGAAKAEEKSVRWRASGSFPAKHSTSIAMETFKKEVARLSDNTIRVDLFPNNTLGGALEQVDQLRTGQIQVAWGSLGFYDRLTPELAAAVLPFGAASSEKAICQIDGEFGAYLNKKMAEKGILIKGWGQVGARHVTNNIKPIKTIEDMKGLKIRTLPGEAWLLTFRALGANPTPIDIKELYQALQQGVVDGQENPYDNMLVRKFSEVQKYLSNTAHFYDWSAYMINREAFEALSEKQQKAVNEAMAIATREQREISARENTTARDALIKAGMQYDEISPQELERFRATTAPVYATMRKQLGDEVMDLAENAIKACK